MLSYALKGWTTLRASCNRRSQRYIALESLFQKCLKLLAMRFGTNHESSQRYNEHVNRQKLVIRFEVGARGWIATWRPHVNSVGRLCKLSAGHRVNTFSRACVQRDIYNDSIARLRSSSPSIFSSEFTAFAYFGNI